MGEMNWVVLRYTLHLIIIWFSTSTSDIGELNKCNTELFIDSHSNKSYNLSSQGYPSDTYFPGASYTWCIFGLSSSSLTLICDDFDIPKSINCQTNYLAVSCKESETRFYCGSKPIEARTNSNDMIISLHSSKKSRGGKFFCKIESKETEHYSSRAIIYDNCDCGYSYRLRIVGGVETGINEFPFMAGLVDARRGAMIVCGAVIISARYVLTAYHCLSALVLEYTAVLVGEHNITAGSETSATKLIKAKDFLLYPYYNSDTRQYDIALIQLASSITYNARVGPVCLPFSSRNWDLTGEVVTVMGWGTTEFGGPRPKVLQKADLNLIDISNCIKAYGENIEPYTQLCTYKQNKDACQYDSGGPLAWFNSYNNRYEVVGLVSYGRGCASGTPSVNTKVAPFLQWILDSTPSETYCYKS